MKVMQFLDSYADSEILRLHMPAHHGKALNSMLSRAYQLDITEILGADSLFEADGIILEGEKRTAQLYGSGSCCWSAGGSTLCIQAMLAKMRTENRTIVSNRTVHRAFLNGCILLGLDVEWVFPKKGDIISGEYDSEDFERKLQLLAKQGEKACIYVTSPDYRGKIQDIAGLAELCRKYGAKLLVDNAHGAHLAFLQENRHPLYLGADYCCDSFHKMLPSLTGAAVLHSRYQDAPELKQYMQMFGSTSPSYLIMRSIEEAVEWLEEKQTLQDAKQKALAIRERIPYDWVGDDPFHLTISANGVDFAGQLRQHGAEPEYADKICCVMLLSPFMNESDFQRLEGILRACKPSMSTLPPELPKAPQRACEMRKACFSEWEMIPIEKAEGRICATVQVPCPPAVPMVMSGEIFDKNWIDYMKYFGLQTVGVIK
ncbi:MAG: amino acid decarboxylase [Oscillospiraceae bacterium]